MKAAENFMKQQVVEIDGKISNNGNRRIRSVDVYCMFYSVDGKEVHRERVPIVHSQGNPLAPARPATSVCRSIRCPMAGTRPCPGWPSLKSRLPSRI